MNQLTKRNLSKIALALAIAGYCAVPAAMAEGTGWTQHSQTTADFNGTIPWIVRNASSDQNAAADQGHVTVTVDRTGRANATPDDGSTEWKRLHVGDKITVSWALGDAEGDVDNNGTLNATPQRKPPLNGRVIPVPVVMARPLWEPLALTAIPLLPPIVATILVLISHRPQRAVFRQPGQKSTCST